MWTTFCGPWSTLGIREPGGSGRCCANALELLGVDARGPGVGPAEGRHQFVFGRAAAGHVFCHTLPDSVLRPCRQFLDLRLLLVGVDQIPVVVGRIDAEPGFDDPFSDPVVERSRRCECPPVFGDKVGVSLIMILQFLGQNPLYRKRHERRALFGRLPFQMSHTIANGLVLGAQGVHVADPAVCPIRKGEPETRHGSGAVPGQELLDIIRRPRGRSALRAVL
ncbi:MAG: hypothetical protein KDK24_17800 [Pseudooceanicola sp.]|nr:hypothetical protein [Maritimibacter sp.]MCB1342881.1 hypothetical protein [Pseudooceanicola sp.]